MEAGVRKKTILKTHRAHEVGGGVDGSTERRKSAYNFAFEWLWGCRCVFLLFDLFTIYLMNIDWVFNMSQAGISFCL